eukprot:TRINITY_DN3838_c0_g2_i1.p1 TRINITY_DN3838_c0_g2~~TRINITY_DN3838_c0_g2_i1.p1  ORF type:complete len:410 (+),score=44.51 TRINITY_DN3838_c0_g2_i1:75-1232(+)
MAVMKLNVGGHHFDVAVSTLTARDGFLKQIAENPRGVGCDTEGRIFLDRDGNLFRYVLEFLRCGAMHPPEAFDDWGMLRNEFVFYFGDSFKDFYVLGDPPVDNHPPVRGAPPEPPDSPYSLSPSPRKTRSANQVGKCFRCNSQLLLSPITTASVITFQQCDLCGKGRHASQQLLTCSSCELCICEHCAVISPLPREVAISRMKDTERASVTGLLNCIKQQIDKYAPEGEGYLGFMHKHYNKLPLNTCKWCIWGGNWSSIRSFQVVESLMQDGYDVILPGQVSIAKLNTTYTCRISDNGEPYLTKATKLRTLKGGFVVAWLRDAITVSIDSYRDIEPRFSSDDLRDYAYGSITQEYKKFLGLMSMSPERIASPPRGWKPSRDTSII